MAACVKRALSLSLSSGGRVVTGANGRALVCSAHRASLTFFSTSSRPVSGENSSPRERSSNMIFVACAPGDQARKSEQGAALSRKFDAYIYSRARAYVADGDYGDAAILRRGGERAAEQGHGVLNL